MAQRRIISPSDSIAIPEGTEPSAVTDTLGAWQTTKGLYLKTENSFQRKLLSNPAAPFTGMSVERFDLDFVGSQNSGTTTHTLFDIASSFNKVYGTGITSAFWMVRMLITICEHSSTASRRIDLTSYGSYSGFYGGNMSHAEFGYETFDTGTSVEVPDVSLNTLLTALRLEVETTVAVGVIVSGVGHIYGGA